FRGSCLLPWATALITDSWTAISILCWSSSSNPRVVEIRCAMFSATSTLPSLLSSVTSVTPALALIWADVRANPTPNLQYRRQKVNKRNELQGGKGGSGSVSL